MQVLLSKKLMDTDIAYLTERIAPSVTFKYPEDYTEQGVINALDNVDVVLGGMITSNVVAQANEVGFFQIPWTGVDSLDFKLIADSGIVVCNSHSNSTIVAEHAIALMLSAAKRIPVHDRKMREKDWNRVNSAGNEVSPFSQAICGTQVLLVGYGAIAQKTEQMLSGFNCAVSVVNSSGHVDGKEANQVFSSDKMADAVAGKDYILICVPLTDQTRDLLDDAVFAAMSESAIVINISRGVIINEGALYKALNEKRIGGAAIDTWYQYPNAENKAVYPSKTCDFHLLNNVVLSPHRAGYCNAGFPHLDDAIENINRYANGEPLINVLSGAKGY